MGLAHKFIKLQPLTSLMLDQVMSEVSTVALGFKRIQKPKRDPELSLDLALKKQDTSATTQPSSRSNVCSYSPPHILPKSEGKSEAYFSFKDTDLKPLHYFKT